MFVTKCFRKEIKREEKSLRFIGERKDDKRSIIERKVQKWAQLGMGFGREISRGGVGVREKGGLVVWVKGRYFMKRERSGVLGLWRGARDSGMRGKSVGLLENKVMIRIPSGKGKRIL
jgi:hypothetical protein